MLKYIIKRILLLFFLVWAVSTLIFALVHVIPGDPIVLILGEGASNDDIFRMRNEFDLDQPLLSQYLDFNKNLLHFDLGYSLYNYKKVLKNILYYFPNTIYLSLAAILVALVISFPLGIIAAFRENSLIDTGISFFSSLGLAIPNFFWGPVLIMIFSVRLGWFPVSGSGGLEYIVLPSLTLGTSMSAFLTRIIKISVNNELRKPYILLARAKGLSEFAVFFKHVLKNAMIPILTTIGLQFGLLMSGTIITENIFSWPGIGTLLIQSINRRDYPMVQGLILFIAFIFLLVNFLVDCTYLVLNPRLRYEIKKK
jgi:peptide/nickel transport system permease protein